MKGLMKKSAVIILSAILMTGTTTITVPTTLSAKTISVSNPVKDGKEVTYDYVYFGSYPQTELTGDDLTSEIIGAKYDKNGDATVNGVKYRKIDLKGSSTSNYGDYELGGCHYFKYEPIRWRVLQNEGDQLFLLADSVLDQQQYGPKNKNWKESSIRSWLNKEFLNTAFSEKEKKAIINSKIVTKDRGGNPSNVAKEKTTDKVFLLSYEEAVNKKYGFSKRNKRVDVAAKMYSSDYAFTLNTLQKSYYKYTDAYIRAIVRHNDERMTSWYLRTPRIWDEQAAIKESSYLVYSNGTTIENTDSNIRMGICPAIKVKASSKLLSTKNPMPDEVIEEPEGRTNPQNPVVDTETGIATYDYVYFGSYPQTAVTGSDLTKEIKKAKYSDDTKNEFRYAEVGTVDGQRYVRSLDESYFKCDPIKWRVLENDGEHLLLMADNILDYQWFYDNENINIKNMDYQYLNSNYDPLEPDLFNKYVDLAWNNSLIRNWLNNEFYTLAFTKAERDSILNTEVTYNYMDFEKEEDMETEKTCIDKVFLLNLQEILNNKYGFLEDIGFEEDFEDYIGLSKKRTNSDFANMLSHSNSYWLVTKAFRDSAWYVKDNGGLKYQELAISGVCPVVRIDLNSNTWTNA